MLGIRGTIIALLFMADAAAAEQRSPEQLAGVEFFEKRVRPLLAEHCYQCHGPDKQRSGLTLNSGSGILQGGDRGPVIVPGAPEASLLIKAIGYTDDDLRMPPKGKLVAEQIADLAHWVKIGAPVPREDPRNQAVLPSSDFNLAERRKHWAYQPVRATSPPSVNYAGWCSSPIDYFILARLEQAGLKPAPPAEKRALIRRVTFDLTGLPPTPAEVKEFIADNSSDAYERLVDRLLASPHYGERWGRHWLDLVRYGETWGFEFDYDLHNAWRYRDYVIRAFNADLPYDQFVIEHLAGDLVPKPRRGPDGCNESVLATGFFWMGEGKQSPVDIRQEQADRVDNQIDVLGKALLAQTIACARCHDHKFDAISTRDYYALAGYLRSSRYQQAFLDPPERNLAQIRRLAELRPGLTKAAVQQLAPQWIEEASQVGRYLIASRQVGDSNTEENLEQAAAAFGLDAPRLGQWTSALESKDLKSIDHPLHAWSKLSQSAPAAMDQGKAELLAELEAQQTRVNQSRASSPTFENFRKYTLEGWSFTGSAFFNGRTVTAGELIVGDRPQRPVGRIATHGAESGLISRRLQGELRSRTFTIEKPFIHYRLAGRQTRVNLVIDGYTLIMNPMYGKLSIQPEEQLTWRTRSVDRWIGHRAFIEILDSSIPMYGLNPPPSSARVPEGPQDGYVVLEQVVFSDDAEPPAEPNRLNKAVLASIKDNSIEALAAAYQDVFMNALQRLRWGRLCDDAESPDEISLVNWMLQAGLLDGETSTPLAAALTEYHRIEASIPAPSRAPALADGSGEDEFVFLRGNHKTLGERAPRGLPEALETATSPAPMTGSGRLEMARRLVDPANPLVARVMVNRLWQHHFGEGIVRTPDDFGRMGQPPTHPELLDYLAAEFVRRRWSMKAMHRLILLSSTYQMASSAERGVRSAEYSENNTFTPHSAFRTPHSVDPENRLLSRMPVRRLEAEAVRDALLALSGRFDPALHGPSVLPYLTSHMEGRGRPKPGPLDGEGRRSIYLNARRNFLTPMFVAFDYPAVFTTVGRRGVTTVPSQALTLLNDPLVVQQARLWAERFLAESSSGAEQRIDALYQAAFARSPTDSELNDALEFITRQAQRHEGGMDDPQSWADLCHVLINVKEFIFVE